MARKSALVFLPLLLLFAAAAAQMTGFSLVVTNSTFLPGEEKEYGAVVITAENTTISSAAFTSTLPFTTNFSANPVTNITNETRSINITIKVPAGAQSGTYTGNISVVHDAGKEEFNASIVVPAVYIWSVSPDTASRSVSNLETGTINFTVNSTSNAGLELAISAGGNASDFLSYSDDLTVLYGVPRAANFVYTIPSTALGGGYQAIILFNRTLNDTRKAVIFLTVGDLSAPTVSALQADSPQSTLPTRVSVIAADNQNVSSVWATVTHPHEWNTTVSNSSGTFVFGHRENVSSMFQLPRVELTNNYSAQFTNTTDVAEYYVAVATNDTVGNTATNRTSFFVTELDAVRAAAELKFPSTKTGVWAEVPFFNISVPTRTRVVLGINYGGAWTAQLVGPTSTLPMDKDTTTAEVSDAGAYTLRIKGEVLGDLYGYAKIEGIPTARRLPNISITGAFVNYTMPMDFTMDLAAGTQMVCHGEDTGDFNSSYYECRVRYPPGIERDGMSILMSTTALNELKAGYNSQIDAANGTATMSQSGLAVIIILTTLYFLWKFIDDNITWAI